MKKTTSWGNEATWYNDLLGKPGTYQHDLILPELLRLINPRPHQTILDLACGQGFFSQSFAAKGADVIGVDIAPELITIAKKQIPKGKFYVSASDQLTMLTNNSVDTAVIVLAIQNIENVANTFAECARVLKPSGTLSLVLNHPCFRIPKQSSWGWDEATKTQYRRLDEYVSESKNAIDMHPGEKTKSETISFHRPLQYYFKALTKNNLLVSRLEEWTSHKHTPAGPRASAENKSRKEFPLFLYLETTKIK